MLWMVACRINKRDSVRIQNKILLLHTIFVVLGMKPKQSGNEARIIWEWDPNSLGMRQDYLRMRPKQSGNESRNVWEWDPNSLGMRPEWAGNLRKNSSQTNHFCTRCGSSSHLYQSPRYQQWWIQALEHQNLVTSCLAPPSGDKQ